MHGWINYCCWSVCVYTHVELVDVPYDIRKTEYESHAFSLTYLFGLRAGEGPFGSVAILQDSS